MASPIPQDTAAETMPMSIITNPDFSTWAHALDLSFPRGLEMYPLMSPSRSMVKMVATQATMKVTSVSLPKVVFSVKCTVFSVEVMVAGSECEDFANLSRMYSFIYTNY